jgi:hypothetical protein
MDLKVNGCDPITVGYLHSNGGAVKNDKSVGYDANYQTKSRTCSLPNRTKLFGVLVRLGVTFN